MKSEAKNKTFKPFTAETCRIIRNNFPQELLDRSQWVAWNASKIPINPHTGQSAKSNDPTTWSSFDHACKRAINDKLAGVGYEFIADDPYVGIDLDHCVDDTGRFETWVREIIDRMRTYAETSPSGTGVHIIGIGVKKVGRSRKDRIEIYDSNRYFTVTGQAIDVSFPDGSVKLPSPLCDCQEELDALYNETFQEEPDKPTQTLHPTPTSNGNGLFLSDDEIIEKAKLAKNGQLFETLWNGQWESGYSSQSEADLALCSIFAFWTRNDSDQIDRLFRRSGLSGLFRPKWDELHGEKTYGEMTVSKAIEGTTDVYTGSRLSYRVSEKALQERFDGNIPSLSIQPHTDYGNAERLIALFGNDIRYDEEHRLWFAWDGVRWCEGGDGKIIQMAKATVRQVYREAISITEQDGGLVKRSPLMDWARKSESRRALKDAIVLSQSECDVPITANELDSNPMVLNVSNGTLDLETGVLREHRRGDLITKLAPITYDPSATCPQWLKFLDRIFDGDQDLIGYLQRSAGYSLIGRVTEDVILFCYGSGRNGKTVFLHVLFNVLGDYGWQADPELLLSNKQTPHETRIAELSGKRLVVTSEIEQGRTLNETFLKLLSSEDTIRARRMYQDGQNLPNTMTIWLMANNKPSIKKVDPAIAERIKLIPFLVLIPPEERKVDLKYRIVSQEASGVLNWMLTGLAEYHKRGLNEPDCVRSATADYMTEQDTIQQFLDDRCLIGEGLYVAKNELYNEYVQWHEENEGGRVVSNRIFNSRIKSKGFSDDRKRINGKRSWVWIGLGLQTENLL